MENDHPLSDAMAANEDADHDLLVMQANIDALAKKYRQRRLLQRSTAGVVLGVGLFTGASYLNGETYPSTPAAGAAVNVQAAAPTSSPFAAGLSPAERDAITRFFAAGYDHEDAAKLALLWKSDDITEAKIAAGEQLLGKRPLPFPPTSQVYDGQTSEEAAMVDAFFAKGYDFNDARKLAQMWKKASPYDAKVEAGKKLSQGEELPFKP